MGAVLQFAQNLVTEECCTCGIAFAMAQGFQKERRERRDNFYCPAGHPQHYLGETEAQILKRQLEIEQRRRQEAEEGRARAQRETLTERQLAGKARAQLKRVRQRVGGGTCPCCKRNFAGLQRHMATKHPEYRHTEVGG